MNPAGADTGRGIFRLPPIWRSGGGWSQEMSMRTSMALSERGIETLGGGRKKDTRKCANPGTQLHCYGKQKRLSIFEMRTKYKCFNEN